MYTFNGEFRQSRNIASLTGCQWFYAKAMFAKANSPFGTVQGCTFPNNSIHAASAINAQCIISATDGGGSKQNRVRTANSQLKNEHGRSFFSVPAGVFCTLLASASSIRKSVEGAEPPWMAVVLCRSEIWAMHKSRR